MNASFEAVLLVEGCHTRTACTEVGMVVGAVEDIGYARSCRNCTKKSSHIICYVRFAQVMSLREVVSLRKVMSALPRCWNGVEPIVEVHSIDDQSYKPYYVYLYIVPQK